MDDKHRDILRRHWSSLRRDLEPVKLLPYLVNVLDPEDEQEVKAKATRGKMIDELLEILPRKGPTAFDNFVKALQEVQPFLAVYLLQEAGIIKYICRFGMQKHNVKDCPCRTFTGFSTGAKGILS